MAESAPCQLERDKDRALILYALLLPRGSSDAQYSGKFRTQSACLAVCTRVTHACRGDAHEPSILTRSVEADTLNSSELS